MNMFYEQITKHTELNPKLFENNKLKPEIRQKILEIVEEFKTFLAEDGIPLDIEDIVLVGSNCSYNYNDNSDLDIHIRIDLSNYADEIKQDYLLKLFDIYRKLWSMKYDIQFYGIPVELYVETKTSKLQEDWEIL